MFPVTDLRTFSVDELVMMFGNSDEDWSVESKPFARIIAPSDLRNNSTWRGNQSGSRIQCRKSSNQRSHWNYDILR